MKVRELLNELNHMDPDAEVHFAYNYGDHWRTTVAPKVESVMEGAVEFSEYHRMPKLIDPVDQEELDDAGGEVVILG